MTTLADGSRASSSLGIASLKVQTFRTKPRTLDEWVRAEGDALRLVYHNVCRLMTEEKFDWVTGIEGRTGFGKSTLAKKVAAYSKAKRGKMRTAYSVLEVLEYLSDSSPGDVIIFDEGANGMFSRQATTIENQAFVLVMMTARAKRVHVLCIIPNRDWFDVYFRGDSMRFVLTVTELGYADLYAVLGPPRWPGDKGRFLFTHRFEDMTEDERAAYEPRKLEFIEEMLQKQIDKLRKKYDPDYVPEASGAKGEAWDKNVKDEAHAKAVAKDAAPHSTSRNPEKLKAMMSKNVLAEPWACPVPRCGFPPTTWKPSIGKHRAWHMAHGDVPQPASSEKARLKTTRDNAKRALEREGLTEEARARNVAKLAEAEARLVELEALMVSPVLVANGVHKPPPPTLPLASPVEASPPAPEPPSPPPSPPPAPSESVAPKRRGRPPKASRPPLLDASAPKGPSGSPSPKQSGKRPCRAPSVPTAAGTRPEASRTSARTRGGTASAKKATAEAGAKKKSTRRAPTSRASAKTPSK